MSVNDEIKIIITGQVNGDQVNIKRKILAELELICSKYDLNFEEVKNNGR